MSQGRLGDCVSDGEVLRRKREQAATRPATREWEGSLLVLLEISSPAIVGAVLQLLRTA